MTCQTRPIRNRLQLCPKSLTLQIGKNPSSQYWTGLKRMDDVQREKDRKKVKKKERERLKDINKVRKIERDILSE
jgi:hypothetical protein